MVKMYLDTSSDNCILRLDGQEYQWRAGHQMSEGLHQFIHAKLQENHQDWADLSEITYFAGPGSFTGLRIGAAVVNTLADVLKIPLYDQRGERHPIIMPEYGRPANISQPKK